MDSSARARLRRFLPLLLVATLAACVSREEYDLAVADGFSRLQASQATAAQQQEQLRAQLQTKIDALEKRVAELDAAVRQKDGAIAEGEVRAGGLQAKLDEATAINQQLAAELQRTGKNVEKLLAERGTLAESLEAAKTRLEELRKAQEAAQQRADLFRSLLAKLRKMVDAGDLQIVLRDGRMVLQLRNDVLFDSGSVEIKAAGKDALAQVAKVLATVTDRNFQVVGHTDNDPISTARFPSNWELSTARAVNVVRYLLDQGLTADVISAGGYAEYDPVAPNDTKENKAKNRRIEIVLQPNIAELVSVPDVAESK